MRKSTLLILAAISFLIALVLLLQIIPTRAQTDPCEPFDNWVGGERFNYVVDSKGVWNLPDDAEITATITFPNSGVWKYYSTSQNAIYIILFRDFDVTQPTGARAGQHHICVYKWAG